MSMTPKKTREDRAQVGVGTLIVFIAMVLVAAIASGVLVTAVGQMQTRGAQASEESAEQVSNRIQVVNAVGSQIDDGNNTVGAINLTVSLSPSAEEVDLSQATVEWLGPSGTYAITHDTSTDGDADFTVTQVKDDDDSAPVLGTRDDRLSMNFDVSAVRSDGSELPAGSTVELRVTTQSGATTIVDLVVPQSVSGESSVNL